MFRLTLVTAVAAAVLFTGTGLPSPAFASPDEAATVDSTSQETPTPTPPATEVPEPLATEVPELPATEVPAPPATEAPAPLATEPPATEAPAITEVRAAAQTVITPFPNGVTRVAGIDRFETAIAVSKRFAPNVPVVYIATADNFPDALTAAAAAAKVGGPLLLTAADSVPANVRAEIVRLAPERIVVAGGELTIGAAVFDQLATLAPRVDRIAGVDRYETGEMLAAEAFPRSTQAFLATGRDFPDALAASAAAGAMSAPVLLIDGRSSVARTSTVMALAALGVNTVRLVGGPGVVSEALEASLRDSGFTVRRHAGDDRFLTAAEVNSSVFGPSARTVFLATGYSFPDALAGAALAGAMRAPLYTTLTRCIPHSVHSTLDTMGITARVVLGGEEAVSAAVAGNTPCALPWTSPAAGRITDVYGPRTPICTPGGCSNSFHYGTDIGTGCWSPIYAASAGTVTHAGWLGTYGNYIKIAHGGAIDTGYAHLVNGGILVSVGQRVATGQQIGWSGTTGASTGCHLHFEVFSSGSRIDPQPFMQARGVRLG